jgi:hypothetical protein
MTSLAAAPGDVLAVWTGNGMFQDLIRVGEALDGKPAVANHVVVITHQDQVGRWMGIQGAARRRRAGRLHPLPVRRPHHVQPRPAQA